MNKILITGGTGLLGHNLIQTNPRKNLAYTYKKNPIDNKNFKSYYFDLEEVNSINQILDDFQRDCLIHTAAIGSVDEAENNPEKARIVNVDSVKYLINECHSRNIKLVYISSNAVYNGKSPPYNEESPRSSVNIYGNLKIESENYILNSSKNYILIRPILMYGFPLPGRRDNPLSWWLKNWKEGKRVKVVNDTLTQPLFVQDCAKIIWKSLEFQNEIFNAAGPEKMTLYEFAIRTARIFSFSEDLIEPVASDFFKSIAPRPIDTSFDITKISKQLGIHPKSISDAMEILKNS